MSVLQAFVDGIGDLIGTSKRSRLNRSVFNPVLGTNLTRYEYNKGIKDSFELNMPPSDFRNWLKQGGAERRKSTASSILGHMSDQGVEFSQGRLGTFISNLQTRRGENPISYVTSQQLPGSAQANLANTLRKQYFSMPNPPKL